MAKMKKREIKRRAKEIKARFNRKHLVRQITPSDPDQWCLYDDGTIRVNIWSGIDIRQKDRDLAAGADINAHLCLQVHDRDDLYYEKPFHFMVPQDSTEEFDAMVEHLKAQVAEWDTISCQMCLDLGCVH